MQLNDKIISSVDVKIMNLEDSNLEQSSFVPDEEGSHKIKKSLYYILDKGKYGIYSWKHGKKSYNFIFECEIDFNGMNIKLKLV